MNYSPACTGSPETITNCIQGGQYVAVNVVAGTVYTFSTCGNTAFDSQITLFNSIGGGALGYNDDGCGLQSTLTWTATFTGTLWVLVDQYNCTNNSVCISLNVTCTAPPPPSSSCLSPLPDICATACSLGTLPAPLACAGGATISTGAIATFSLSNVGAIAENPYSTVAGCANPGTDVWYRFQATGTQLVFNIASLANVLNNPNVSLYNGNNCNALLPLACFTGTGGTLSQTYSPITPGDFYYLQISGGNAADVGDFTLTIRNNYDCDNCLLVHDLQVTPAPVNGTYGAGQTVQFCFTVSNYNQTALNWLHGIDLNFGSGWNLSTLSATTIPASCAATAGAYWGFYNSVTGNVTGTTYGPGFWYETTSGSSSGVIDANPGNNFGDAGVGTACPRTFCWQITTNPPGSCTPGSSLAVSVNTLGDYETGSWGSPGCTGDPIINFLASLACCAQPIITVGNTNCGLSDGKIVASGNGSAPWDYVWANASGTVIATHNNINGADSIIGLASGNYFLTVTDNLGCSVGTSITVNASSGGTAIASNTGPYCAGQTITLNSSAGGTGYNWSGPGGYTSTQQNPTRANSSNAMGGTYSVTVTFAGGCTATATTNVTVNNLPVASISPATLTICSGGSATLVANGGNSYAWSNSGNTASITVSPVTNTIYTVTVTDINTCTATASRLVTVNTLPVAIISPATIAICSGASATLNASGGGSYAWSNASTTASIIVSPGTTTTYTVTVTDANTCTATASRVVTVNSLPIATVSPASTAICTGMSTMLTASAGNTYTWSNSANTSSITVAPSTNTTYVVTITDINACTATASGAITVNPLPVASVSPSSATICNGAGTTLTANGGNTYLWSNSANTTSITVSPASNTTYTVTVTDINTCTGTASSTVIVIPTMNLSTSVANVSCNGGATGDINLTINSGQSPYTFAWSNSSTAQNLINITAGTYSVTVTDNSLCTAVTSATVTEPSSLSVSEIHTDVACGGATPGAIDVTVSGGVLPYVYTWNDGIATQDRLGISAGNYSLTVTDNNLCSASISVPINTGSALLLSETRTDVLCYGNSNGTINVTGTGGTTPYTFSWNDGIATQNRIGLVAGTYTVTAYDAASCSASLSIIINEPSPFSVSITHTDVTCNGGSTGTMTLSSAGGTLPYTYLWNDGSTSQNRNFVTAGNYAVTVTDSHNCTFSISTIVTQPGVLSVAATHTDVLCSGTNTGAIDISVNGGTSPYAYLWNDGTSTEDRSNIPNGNYIVTVTDNNLCSVSLAVAVISASSQNISETHTDVTCNSFSDASINVTVTGGAPPYNYLWNDGATTQNRINISAGNFSVSATDNNSCVVSLVVTITEPTVLSISETHTDVLCYGGNTGNINVAAGGATLPYTFLWSDAATTEDRSNLIAGNYSVTVTDNNLCSSSIAVSIAEPTALSISETHTNVLCAGGTTGFIDATASGGTLPHTFVWNDGVTTEDRNNIPAGNYSVSVVDNNFCNSTLFINITEPTAVTISETHGNVSCNGGNDGWVDITTTGGTPPYTFVWSTGTTPEDLLNIWAGNYSVTAIDNNYCSFVLSISIIEPSLLNVTEVHSNVSCMGYSDASAVVSVSGGTSPYTYLWNDGTVSQTKTNLQTGHYTITVSDNNLCTASTSFTIVEPTGILLNSSVTNPTCVTNNADGSITLNITGGSVPYHFSWSNGSGSQNLTNILPGNYLVTVTDANNCSVEASFMLAYQYAFSVDATPSASVNFGESTTLGYTLTGVAGNYVSVWTPSNSLSCTDCITTVATPTATTIYQITITNDAGCVAADEVIVTVVPDYSIFVPNAFTPNGDGNNDIFEIFGNTRALEYLEIQIFNRWGEKVFESYDHHFSWDGTFKGVLQNPGVYVWQLKLTFQNGHREELRMGTVTLIK